MSSMYRVGSLFLCNLDRNRLSWKLTFLLLGLAFVVRPGFAQGYPAVEAIQHMTPLAGFDVKLVASEPLVRQPVAIEFDDRGRLWVIQYLQYPNPAGLKRLEVDRFSRTKYDRVPEPPPHGPRGADRITILEDTNQDGFMDHSRDFVEGLNLATGLAFGHGGVFVLNVPYLLFYPDRDRDDVPDSNPEVLLAGFGMEDAHSVANSLTWGPDGWLYGCQGSTVTASIRGIEFQQGVWRYHPISREFELFCEGGGNSWGLDFDAVGNLLYSTNYGGHVLLHGVQGGYYVKSFAKHGELHNPHSYGYFDHAPHQNFRGGHVTVGGISYQGGLFPDSFTEKYIAGDLLGHGVYWHDVENMGSTFATRHGGELLISRDTWFAPTDVTVGPDGAVYVADWQDARTAHPDPDADWDRSNGRIYRIAPAGAAHSPPFDLAKLTVDELSSWQRHRNQWQVRTARRELASRINGRRESDRQIDSIIEDWQQEATRSSSEKEALEAVWSLHAIDRFDETLAFQLLESPHPAVRSWTVRLLGDRRQLTPQLAHRLDEFAERESAAQVRLQLACSARRFPAHQALPIINANINRDLDLDDPYLPLLWWWAIEEHSVSGRDEVMKRFVRPSLWKSRLGSEFLLPRLVRRYTSEGNVEGWDWIVRLLQAAPDESSRQQIWEAVWPGWLELSGESSEGFRRDIAPQHPLSKLALESWKQQPANLTSQRFAAALGHRDPLRSAKQEAFDKQVSPERQVELLSILENDPDKSWLEPAIELIKSSESPTVRQASLRLLSRLASAETGQRLLQLHFMIDSPALASQIRDVLMSRREFARVWLQAVERGEIAASTAGLDQIRRVSLLNDPELNAIVTRHWGKLDAASPEERLAEVRRLNNDLRAGSGQAKAGRELFKKHCASCHQLFGEGTKVGPDLTTANRMDRDFLLISLVDPGSVIRKEFMSVVVETTDGRVMSGFPVSRDASTLTLIDAKNIRTTINTADIAQQRDSDVSLMPLDLHRQLKPQELRDLFAYLQSQSGE